MKRPGSRRKKIGNCELCARECYLTFHHLIPKQLHRRAVFKKRYSPADLAAGINICRPCHSALHRFFPLMTLARDLNTLDKLASHPTMEKHVEWAARQRIRID